MQHSLSRRFLVAGALLLPAQAVRATGLAVTPGQTEGPFYPVAYPADTDNDLVQIRGAPAKAMGTVLHLDGRVLDSGGRKLGGATVEIWQSDWRGLYDHPRQGGRERRDSAFQGYGRIAADADGRYSFRTLKPVAYPGRAPHIHFKVATADGRKLTSQFYLAGDPQNDGDFVFKAAARDPRQRERVEMRLAPANGVEAGAFASTMDIVIG